VKVKHIATVVLRDKSFLSKIPALFRMLKVSLQGRYRPGIKNLVIFSLLILYLAFPIDLIPDFLIGIGILDDITIAFFALTKLFREVDKYIEWEKQKTV
jgi:uncharacterized membrane protein YkvA (DUF1232 family)